MVGSSMQDCILCATLCRYNQLHIGFTTNLVGKNKVDNEETLIHLYSWIQPKPKAITPETRFDTKSTVLNSRRRRYAMLDIDYPTSKEPTLDDDSMTKFDQIPNSLI